VKLVTPREFRDAFVEVMRAQRKSVRVASNFEAKSFNYFMRSEIFPRIARELKLLAWNKEYYTLDGAFYEERENEHVRVNESYAKWICVAIEHEVDLRSSYREMNKLQLFNVPLKVLIAYVAEGIQEDTVLRGYERIVRAADAFGDVASTRRQLVILGTLRGLDEWRIFVFEQDGFVQMLPLPD
jgi:hypothetical protein